MANQKKARTAKSAKPSAAEAITEKLEGVAALTGEAKIKAIVAEMGIKETREVMRFAVALVQSYRAAISDGQITGTDVQFLVLPITLLVPAVSGANLIAKEMADLDEAEKLQLADEFSEVVRNPLYRRLFVSVIEMGDAIIEIVQEGKEGDEEPAVFVADRNLD